MWFAVNVYGFKLTLPCAEEIIQVMNKMRTSVEIYFYEICLHFMLTQTVIMVINWIKGISDCLTDIC